MPWLPPSSRRPAGTPAPGSCLRPALRRCSPGLLDSTSAPAQGSRGRAPSWNRSGLTFPQESVINHEGMGNVCLSNENFITDHLTFSGITPFNTCDIYVHILQIYSPILMRLAWNLAQINVSICEAERPIHYTLSRPLLPRCLAGDGLQGCFPCRPNPVRFAGQGAHCVGLVEKLRSVLTSPWPHRTSYLQHQEGGGTGAKSESLRAWGVTVHTGASARSCSGPNPNPTSWHNPGAPRPHWDGRGPKTDQTPPTPRRCSANS